MEPVTKTEVQSHGFRWEKELAVNVYHSTEIELKNIKYTNKTDIPALLNRLDGCDLSVKTTCSQNKVCMADCLRIFDAVSSETPLHMVVLNYKQYDESQTKKIVSIIEIDLTSSRELLFGSITRSQLEELDKAVKSVPQKRKPTEEEYTHMYRIRNQLQPQYGDIHLDIKCNSQQSRLQCSFNHFQQFIEKNPKRVIAYSHTNIFRGGEITNEISSSRRVFKKKPEL